MKFPIVNITRPEIPENWDANKFLLIKDIAANKHMIRSEIDRALYTIKEREDIDCEEIHQYITDLRSLLSQFICDD